MMEDDEAGLELDVKISGDGCRAAVVIFDDFFCTRERSRDKDPHGQQTPTLIHRPCHDLLVSFYAVSVDRSRRACADTVG